MKRKETPLLGMNETHTRGMLILDIKEEAHNTEGILKLVYMFINFICLEHSKELQL